MRCFVFSLPELLTYNVIRFASYYHNHNLPKQRREILAVFSTSSDLVSNCINDCSARPLENQCKPYLLLNLTTRSKRVFGKELLEKLGKSRRSSSRSLLWGLGIAPFHDHLDSDSLPKYNNISEIIKKPLTRSKRQFYFLMFHLAIIAIISLRVVLCPLFCVGDGALDSGHQDEVFSCACAKSNSGPCHSNERQAPVPLDCPCDSPFPCDSGCVCKAAPELNGRTATTDFELSLDFAPVCMQTVSFSEVRAIRHEVHSPRLDNGRSIRLVFASLLL